jgi:HSP20 family molecular chaperone IbpA
MLTTSSPALAILRALDNMSSTPVVRGGEFVPRHNAKTSDGKIVYEIALPGFTRSDIKVEMSGTSLSVSSDTSREYSDYVVAQSRVRPFSVSFPTPSGSEVESATLRDGMLIVTIRTQHAATTIPVT